MFFHYSKRDSSRVLLTELRAKGAKSAIYSKNFFEIKLVFGYIVKEIAKSDGHFKNNS